MRALFGNVCINKRIWSHGGPPAGPPDPPLQKVIGGMDEEGGSLADEFSVDILKRGQYFRNQ